MPLATCCEPVECEPLVPFQERTIVTLSIRCAISGNFSQMNVPGTLVLMGFQMPRISAGASGLGSNVSNWLGPPARNKKIHETSRRPLTVPPRAEIAAG